MNMHSKQLQWQLSGVVVLMLIAFTCTTTTQAVSISQIGDVEIYSNETHFKCDRIYCPSEAQRCQVLKAKQDNNSTLVRKNICYGPNDNVINQQIFTETADPKGVITLEMNSYRHGFSSSIHSAIINNNIVSSNVPNEVVQKELDLHLSNAQRINEDVQRQVETINKDIERNIQNIQQQLQATFQNLFHT